MRKKNILIKIHQPGFKKKKKNDKKKSLFLIPAAAFKVVSFCSHDNESVRAIHWFFSKTF